jgi:hypothetical protein
MSSHPELLPFLADQLMLEMQLFNQPFTQFQLKSFKPDLQAEDKSKE